MELKPLQQLLRTFFSYGVSLILYLDRNGKIAGVFLKDDVESLMSNLDEAEKEPPLHDIQSLDDLLELYQEHGVLQKDSKILPAVNDEFEFAGEFARKEIIENWNLEAEKAPEEPQKVYAPRIITTTPRPKIMVKQPGVRAGEKPSREVNLSLMALEALPLPMLAVDVKGKTLFHNQDWDTFREKFPILETHDLMSKTKDEMAQRAFDGELTVYSTLEFSDIIPRALIKMRSLLDESGMRPRVAGYLFWIDRQMQSYSRRLEAPPIPEKIQTPAKSKEPNSYSGKTLNDILAYEEKKALSWAMTEAGNNQSNAALLLGIPRQTFAYRYKKYFS